MTLWGFSFLSPAPESNFPFPPGWPTPGHSISLGDLAVQGRARFGSLQDTAQKDSLRLAEAKVSLRFAPGGTFMGLAKIHRQPLRPMEAVRVFWVSDGDTHST